MRAVSNLAQEQADAEALSVVRIHLIGTMQAVTYLGASMLPRGRKARAILGVLCLSPGGRASRTRLASLLWDRVPDAQARTSLRQALHELSLAMNGLAPELMQMDRESVKLNLAACWIDAAAILEARAPAQELLRSDLAALCKGELLEELIGASPAFDQWLLAERSRFSERLRAIFEAELQERVAAGAPAEQRAALARQLIGFDATHEGASRALMRALADLGERAQALREFERCREALRLSLDVEPSRETAALCDAIRAMPARSERARGAASQPSAEPPSILPFPAKAARRGRLRVGVLPFLAAGSSADETLAFSLGHEIAAALARFRWFDVIAPISLSRQPSGAAAVHDQPDFKELDYAVDGAVTGDGERLQISVRLLDLAQLVRPVWSDRFELPINALNQLDELVTSPIVARIDPVILFIEGSRKGREQSDANTLLLHAIPLMYRMEREKYEEAGRLINEALKIDPDNAMACAWAAFWQVFHVGQGWTQDHARSLSTAQELALKAIKLDPENAEALAIYGHICAFLDKDFDSAVHYFDRSLRLNPNLAFTWAMSAATCCYIGEPDIALERLARHRELAPFDPYFFWIENLYTIAYAFKGDYEQAVSVGRRVVRANPEYSNAYKPLIAALGHLDRHEEAKPHIEKLLSLEPNFTVQRHGQVYPFRQASDREHYLEGLRRAGVAEG
jgi:DNA-binding SARP family transcriptional activator/TolB-like protein/Flp pilus assembly protein TadD